MNGNGNEWLRRSPFFRSCFGFTDRGQDSKHRIKPFSVFSDCEQQELLIGCERKENATFCSSTKTSPTGKTNPGLSSSSRWILYQRDWRSNTCEFVRPWRLCKFMFWSSQRDLQTIASCYIAIWDVRIPWWVNEWWYPRCRFVNPLCFCSYDVVVSWEDIVLNKGTYFDPEATYSDDSQLWLWSVSHV